MKETDTSRWIGFLKTTSNVRIGARSRNRYRATEYDIAAKHQLSQLLDDNDDPQLTFGGTNWPEASKNAEKTQRRWVSNDGT